MTTSGDTWLADIVRSSPDAIVGERLDGVVTVWNRAAEVLYGYRAEEIIGQRADQLHPPERRVDEAALARRVACGERVDQCVTERIRRDGTTTTVSMSVSPIIDDTGAIIGIASVSRAIGASHHAEDRTQDVLHSRTSHELRTPLQAIIGFTGTLLLRLPGPLNDEQERQLQLVQASAEQLLTLINRLSRPPGAPGRND